MSDIISSDTRKFAQFPPKRSQRNKAQQPTMRPQENKANYETTRLLQDVCKRGDKVFLSVSDASRVHSRVVWKQSKDAYESELCVRVRPCIYLRNVCMCDFCECACVRLRKCICKRVHMCAGVHVRARVCIHVNVCKCNRNYGKIAKSVTQMQNQ